MRRARRIIVMAAATAAIVPAGAAAHKIEVHRGDSLRHAVSQASDGDVVVVHPGRYRTHLKISKKINLVGVGKTRPIIDAGCHANDTITVTSPGVTISGLKVQGADVISSEEQYPAEVYFEGVASGKATDLRTIDTCDAEYGISAFGTGPVKVTNNFGRGFRDSAIYIGTPTDTLGSTLLVEDNTAVDNSRGIIIERTPVTTEMTLRGNTLNDNTIPGTDGPSDGLLLYRSSGVLIADNVANGNAGSGYHADPNSDHNVFKDNTASGNAIAPFTDENGQNCGSGNSFLVPPTCP